MKTYTLDQVQDKFIEKKIDAVINLYNQKKYINR